MGAWVVLSILNFLEIEMFERRLLLIVILMWSLFLLKLLRRGITIVVSEIREPWIVKLLLLGMIRVMLLRGRLIISHVLMLKLSHKLNLWMSLRCLLISIKILVRIHILYRQSLQRKVNCFYISLILVFLIK
jgi:hypothetical protein